MKITIDIPEDEILEKAKLIVSEYIAKEMLDTYYSTDNYCYKRVIKDVVREVIKDDKANLENRAVETAAKSIKKEAIKKLMAEVGE